MWSVNYQRHLKTVKSDFKTENVYRGINIITKKASIECECESQTTFEVSKLKRDLNFYEKFEIFWSVKYTFFIPPSRNITFIFLVSKTKISENLMGFT